MNHDEARGLIARQFDEESLPDREAHALRAHLRACEPCRGHYDRHVELERRIAGGAHMPAAQKERLLVLALDAAAAPPRHTGRLRALVLAASASAAVLAAAAALVLVVRPTGEGFTARGPGGGAHAPWVRVLVQRGDAVAPLGDTLHAGDALLFAYTNPAGSPYRHLAIAGRDAAGRAFWYHPAWTDPAAPPRGAPIPAGVTLHEIPAAVRTEPAPGPLRLCAMFTREPLDVAAADARIEREDRWPGDALLDCKLTRVVR
jgi:hypothetical protein